MTSNWIDKMDSPDETVKKWMGERDQKKAQVEKSLKAIAALSDVLDDDLKRINEKRMREFGVIVLERFERGFRILRESPAPMYDCLVGLEEEKAKEIHVTYQRKDSPVGEWREIDQRLLNLDLDKKTISDAILQGFVALLERNR